jgi:hypothetical protein
VKQLDLLGLGLGLTSDVEQLTNLKVCRYFNDLICQIEIVDDRKQVQRVYFPKIEEVSYLSDRSKERLLYDAPRQTANDKIKFFLRSVPRLLDEI